MAGLIAGHKCKACGASLTKNSIDVELCNICMEVVLDYNADLIDLMTASDLEKHYEKREELRDGIAIKK